MLVYPPRSCDNNPPNLFGALSIGAMYVLGMITLLLLIALFLNGKMPAASFLKREVLTLRFFGKNFYVIMSNLIAAMIFLFSGWMILVFSLTGKLAMSDVKRFTKTIQNTAYFINQYDVGDNLFLNLIFVAVIILAFISFPK